MVFLLATFMQPVMLLAEDNTLDSYYFELASEVKGNLEKIETTTSEPEVVVKNTNNSALYKTFLSCFKPLLHGRRMV